MEETRQKNIKPLEIIKKITKASSAKVMTVHPVLTPSTLKKNPSLPKRIFEVTTQYDELQFELELDSNFESKFKDQKVKFKDNNLKLKI